MTRYGEIVRKLLDCTDAAWPSQGYHAGVDKKEINSPKLTLNFVLVILLPLVLVLLVIMHHWGVF